MAKRAKIHQGATADGPSFCWHCGAPLSKVPGEEGHYFFALVRDEIGAAHRASTASA